MSTPQSIPSNGLDSLSLGETWVVDYLIKNRTMIDPAYTAEQESNSIVSSNGVFDLCESVICIYIDLERLIDLAPLTKAERTVVNLMMKGYTFEDLAERYNRHRSLFNRILERAEKKICQQNTVEWEKVYGISQPEG